MRRFRLVMLILAGVPVLLAGCSDYGPGPALTGGTEYHVTFRFDPTRTRQAEVDEEAADYCESGTTADLVGGIPYTATLAYAEYDCVPVKTASAER